MLPSPKVVARRVSFSVSAPSRSCSSKGSPRRTTASTTEKMAVVAPTPSVRTRSAAKVKLFDARSDRTAAFKSSCMSGSFRRFGPPHRMRLLDVHRLDVHELLDAVAPQLAAVARCLDAAERKARVGRDEPVHHGS